MQHNLNINFSYMLYIYIFPYNGSSKIGYVTCFNIGFSCKVFSNARFCFQSYQDNKFVSLLLASFVTYFVLNCTQIQHISCFIMSSVVT